MGHREEERVVLVGTDQRITSGPAAKTAAFKGRIHGCTRTLRSNVRFLLHRGRRPYMAHGRHAGRWATGPLTEVNPPPKATPRAGYVEGRAALCAESK